VENNGLKFVKKINEYGKAGISTDLALHLASRLNGPTVES
jgi:hypothetical protein